MKAKYGILILACVTTLWGQRVTDRRTADIRGGGGDGKCTIEVYVDDVAEVEIRGREATIRTINGAPASIRRFQCNQELPNSPNDFRYKGVDGRGRQELVRSPGGRGPAVVRVEDSKGGSEGYTFDIFWRGGSGGYNSGSGSQNGWDNGWGNGSGWTNSSNVNYSGGREGSGEYRDRNGQRRRLDTAKVFISSNGFLTVSFKSDRGNLTFSGNVNRRDGRRVYADVSGSGARGTMEVDMSSHNEVRRIYLRDIDLEWKN